MIWQATRERIEEASRILRAGGCVALPTETVYGLAADALNPRAVLEVYERKARPAFDPLIVHVAMGNDDWRDLVCNVPDWAESLIRTFWPGPLTLVLPRTSRVPDLVTSGLDSVALRCPAHPVMQRVLELTGRPLAAPSANKFGRISPTQAGHVENEFGGEVPVVDGGACRIGLESTVIDARGARPQVLRPGGLPLEDLETVTGPLVRAVSQVELRSPGMLKTHYAPRKPLYLVEGPAAAVPFWKAGCGVLCFDGRKKLQAQPARTEILSATGDAREAAASLFAKLRELDEDPTVLEIAAEPAPESGLGSAINDRLSKAAGLG
jgi:L-threonylcarbamoyladenylate synthase